MIPNSPIRAERIGADIDALAAITEPGRPWTRRAFTPMFLKGRAWLAEAMQQAGATTRIDAAGNLVATICGHSPRTRHHHAGQPFRHGARWRRFDGIAGVIAGLEVVRTLRDQGITLDHTLEVADFLAEEVSIFGVSCIGSRGISGTQPFEWLTREIDGLTLEQGIAEVGSDSQ